MIHDSTALNFDCMNDEERNVEMQHLVAEVFELAGVLRRDGEAIAKLAGQTQARWQVMWIAATGRFSVAMIARRLGLTRQASSASPTRSSPRNSQATNPTPTTNGHRC